MRGAKKVSFEKGVTLVGIQDFQTRPGTANKHIRVLVTIFVSSKLTILKMKFVNAVLFALAASAGSTAAFAPARKCLSSINRME